MNPWRVVPELYLLPEITEINRLPMHSGLIPWPNAESARPTFAAGAASPFFQSLDGTWDFIRLARPELTPADFAAPGYKMSKWRKIQVPSNWTRQNTEDLPIYTNVKMPFANTPPIVPEENPTGLYRTKFTVPASWKDRRVVIQIGGAESYLEVYLNGKFIGMGKDTRLCSDFDLTPALNFEGENVLACRVIRWSDSTYIEDQDQWWMAGIYRSVFLYATEKAYLEDVWVNGDLDLDSGDGLLRIRTHAGFDIQSFLPRGPERDYALRCVLKDAGGREVWRESARIHHLYRAHQYTNVLEGRLNGVRPWSAEIPYLYTLTVEMLDAEGCVVDCRATRVGFRNIQLGDRELLFNGEKVYIRGVNRHEHDQVHGKTLSMEGMMLDMFMLKSFNYNAIRCCHYPDDVRWYDLCDEYGIYVIDEADIECHANYATMCRDPRWRSAYIARVSRMVLRDRNHPSIFCWSMGNESGNGENHTLATEAALALDDTRMIHNEGEIKTYWDQGTNMYDDVGVRYNSFADPMYPEIEILVDWAERGGDRRPFIMCEYSHGMGNSNGSLADYWKAIESHHGLQGGFIWDWVDQAFLEKTPDGKGTYWTYGGDYGEKDHDFDFVCNGMVFADRTPHPAMWEFKYLSRPVRVTAMELATRWFAAANWYNFRTLEHLEGRWELLKQGVKVAEGEIETLYAAPGDASCFEIPFPVLDVAPGEEAHLHIAFALRNAEGMLEAGHVVATDEIDVTGAMNLVAPEAPARVSGKVELKSTKTRITVRAGALEVVVDRAKGAISSISRNAEALAVSGPVINLWRAATDNDGIRGWSGQESKALGRWLGAGLDRLTLLAGSAEAAEKAGCVELTLRQTLGAAKTDTKVEAVQIVTIAGDGSIHCVLEGDVASSSKTLPRFGVVLELAKGFETVEYFGRGPHENYTDRRASAFFGRYSDTVDGMFTPYVMPQENGNRTDVRELLLSSGKHTMTATAEFPFEFTASHFRASELFAGRHVYELRRNDETIVTLDLKQAGLGTNSCGPKTRPEYEIAPGKYRFAYTLRFD